MWTTQNLQNVSKGQNFKSTLTSYDFFLGLYDFNENYLLKVVEYSHTIGQNLVALNTTFLSLIPRIGNPYKFEIFKNISLCNSIYKIISKMISCRQAVGVEQEGIVHSIKTRN